MPYLTKTWNELRMFENDDLKKNRESHFIFSPVRTNVCLLSFVIIIDFLYYTFIIWNNQSMIAIRITISLTMTFLS